MSSSTRVTTVSFHQWWSGGETIAYVVSSAYFDQVGIGNGELYEMAHAHTHADIKAALAPMDLYPANLILAGRDGTLLYIRPGRLPKRPDGRGRDASRRWVDVSNSVDGIRFAERSSAGREPTPGLCRQRQREP